MKIKKLALVLFTLLSLNTYAQEEKKCLCIGVYSTTKDKFWCDNYVFETLEVPCKDAMKQDNIFRKAHENDRAESTIFYNWQSGIAYQFLRKDCDAGKSIGWLTGETIDDCETSLKKRLADGDFKWADIVVRWGVRR